MFARSLSLFYWIFVFFLSRSLQGPRPPSTVSVTVWKMYYIRQHIPLRSHYPRGLRGNTPKVCPLPHAYFQGGVISCLLMAISVTLIVIRDWNFASLLLGWVEQRKS